MKRDAFVNAPSQLMLFYPRDEVVVSVAKANAKAIDAAQMPLAPNLDEYDRVIVFFSGGKDSLACVLHLIEMGVPREKIELHHHLVDGREGSTMMDWPVTDAYCAAFAAAFGLRYIRSWKMGGFEREMLRQDGLTAPIAFERLDGSISVSGGKRGDRSTRRKFPQTSNDLLTRWCSPYLKIDVGARLLTQDRRFLTGKTLVVTGERADESTNRAGYAKFERYRAHRIGKRVQRYVDHWRPAHGWSEEQVWAIIERHCVNPHPAYKLGFGRCSCRFCIFLGPDHWATLRKYFPMAFAKVAGYEDEFGVTIARSRSIIAAADAGTPMVLDEHQVMIANSEEYLDDIIVKGPWTLPKGAYGDSAGPT
jgi:3'-phosphoadenosine 5'-phosphosulfate sulfotransferase (PAPS reductase)/FAD synthetase